MFYNTGIATYIWVLSNRKPEHRRGKVQLIDATGISQPLRKNLGKKNCELSDEQIRQITEMFLAFAETEQSKIFPSEAFGYWKITVERPLRLTTNLSNEKLARFEHNCLAAKDGPLAHLVQRVAQHLGPGPHLDFNVILAACEADAAKHGINLTAKRLKLLQAELTVTNEKAAPVIRRIHKPGKTAADPLQGLYEVEMDGKIREAEYEPDSSLRDTEQVPLLEEGGIEAVFHREVLPHVPDAWIDQDKTQIGYEISFTRHFYKPQTLRLLAEIRADLEALQAESEGLLEQIVRGATA
jgi:type I restriction enzyme M protein